MATVKPYTNSKGEIVYDMGSTKVTLNPKSERFAEIDRKINDALYVKGESGEFIRDSNGKMIFKDGVTKQTVIQTVHDFTHEVVGEYDKVISDKLDKGEDVSEYYHQRDGDTTKDADGDNVTETDKLDKDEYICADYSATEHHFLINNGVDDAKLETGYVGFRERDMDKKDSYHAFVSVNDGRHVLETTQPKGNNIVNYVKDENSYNAGKGVVVTDTKGKGLLYSKADDVTKAYEPASRTFFTEQQKTDDLRQGALENDMSTKNPLPVAKIDTSKPFEYEKDRDGGNTGLVKQGSVIINGKSVDVSGQRLADMKVDGENAVRLPFADAVDQQVAEGKAQAEAAEAAQKAQAEAAEKAKQEEQAKPETDKQQSPVPPQPETDKQQSPVPPQPETDKQESPVPPQPETDKQQSPVPEQKQEPVLNRRDQIIRDTQTPAPQNGEITIQDPAKSNGTPPAPQKHVPAKDQAEITDLKDEKQSMQVAANLNDNKAANDTKMLDKFGITVKEGAYTDKTMSQAIAERAKGGFSDKEIEEIRAMSQEKGADGKSAHINDSEKGAGYKQGVSEVALGELQAPTTSSAGYEPQKVASR